MTFYVHIAIYPQGVYIGDMNSELKKRSNHRTQIIKGQLDGLQKMIDNESYCMDILTQSLAIQKSLASLNKLVLENHLQTHITSMMASGDEGQQDKAIHELLRLYELHVIRGK